MRAARNKRENNQDAVSSSEAVDRERAVSVEAMADNQNQDDLDRLAGAIRTLKASTAASAFQAGEIFREAKAILPEKGFGKWLKSVSDYTVRSAWNYISIVEKLSDYRDVLIETGVAPTFMFELAKGEPVQIAAVVARIAAGEKLKVSEVRQELGGANKQQAAVGRLQTGGLTGLRAAAEAKFQADSVRFAEHIDDVISAVEQALEPLKKGRAVKKGQLIERVVYVCRHAHDLINSVAAPLKPALAKHQNWTPAKLAEDTPWSKVQALLYLMGSLDTWPEQRALVPWLQSTVLPLLRFARDGEALPATITVDWKAAEAENMPPATASTSTDPREQNIDEAEISVPPLDPRETLEPETERAIAA